MCCRHDCRTLRSLNFYNLRFTLCTILKGPCQGACNSSITYQCVLHIRHCSCAGKCAMRVAHDVIGSFRWDNNHLGGIPSFPVRLLATIGNIAGGLTGRDDVSLTSMGVIDEAITNCFDSLLKGVSLPAPLYTLLNHWVSTLYA